MTEGKNQLQEIINGLLYLIEELAEDNHYYLIARIKELRSKIYKFFRKE